MLSSNFFKKNKKEILVISTLLIVLLVLYKTRKKPESKNVILLGGLDNRAGDKKIEEQVEIVKSGLSKPMQVQGFRYFDINSTLKAIEENPNSYVLCFSAGCQYAEQLATQIKDKNGDLNKLFIIEPYHSGGTTTKSVRKAVELGVPSKNVFVGTYAATGLGIVENSSKTPSCSPAHWCALKEVAKVL